MTTIAVEHLTKRYGAVRAVDDLTSRLNQAASPASSVRTVPAKLRPCGSCSVSPDQRPGPRPSTGGRTPTSTTRSATSER